MKTGRIAYNNQFLYIDKKTQVCIMRFVIRIIRKGKAVRK